MHENTVNGHTNSCESQAPNYHRSGSSQSSFADARLWDLDFGNMLYGNGRLCPAARSRLMETRTAENFSSVNAVKKWFHLFECWEVLIFSTTIWLTGTSWASINIYLPLALLALLQLNQLHVLQLHYFPYKKTGQNSNIILAASLIIRNLDCFRKFINREWLLFQGNQVCFNKAKG